jgi:hypothetical protein
VRPLTRAGRITERAGVAQAKLDSTFGSKDELVRSDATPPHP